MLLDISNAIKQEGNVFPFMLSGDFGRLEFGGDIFTFPEPVKIKGEFNCNADICFVTGEISTQVESVCVRCLEAVRIDMQIPFSEEYVQKADIDYPDRHVYSGDKIELNEIILADLVLNLPIRVLCSEDCKGLCGQCGQNLNKGNCACQKESE
jgi:uncharacterized protein